jgi:hypothetical protein
VLTLFTTAKPFLGHAGVIQRNALRSWTLLRPRCEILLFGDDEGAAEVAAELGVTHLPQVGRNEHGKLVSDLFAQAERRASHELLCYANADMVLLSDLAGAAARVAQLRRPFLMVGQRWDLEVQEPLDFDEGWEERLRATVREAGSLHPPYGIDYFLFRRGMWGPMPPFVVGRAAWDNWMVYEARRRRAYVIDATKVVFCVHQNHDYSHYADGKWGAYRGPGALHNRELGGGPERMFNVADATHVLTPQDLRWAVNRRNLREHLRKLVVLHPWLLWPAALVRPFWRGHGR